MTWREIVLAVWKVSLESHWLAAVNEASLFLSNRREIRQRYSGAVGLVELVLTFK